MGEFLGDDDDGQGRTRRECRAHSERLAEPSALGCSKNSALALAWAGVQQDGRHWWVVRRDPIHSLRPAPRNACLRLHSIYSSLRCCIPGLGAHGFCLHPSSRDIFAHCTYRTEYDAMLDEALPSTLPLPLSLAQNMFALTARSILSQARDRQGQAP